MRDRVLLIEQFRMGPYARGDAEPWLIEAIAGRVDPGETPEDAARREA
ncbi:MAG: NUDIX domain-containing protein, partial [Rhodobacteraceae bacterium]|nr:NUDIX domain-containing protein [Paracoccaceae bacterium]